MSWNKLGENPETPFELIVLTQSYAELGDLKALNYAEKLAKYQPIEADITRAILFYKRDEFKKSVSILKKVFSSFQDNPWVLSSLIKRSLRLSIEITKKKKHFAKELFDALKTPFSVRLFQRSRRNTLLFLAEKIDAEHVRQIVSPIEPNIPWEKKYLLYRKKAYQKLNDPRAKLAEEQYNEFVENLETGIEDDLDRKTTKE